MADVSCSLVNGGWLSEPFTGATRDALWAVLKDKVYRPEEYLPVKDVATKEMPDGRVWRTMKLARPLGPDMKEHDGIVEHINMDEAAGEIAFVVLNKDGTESNVVHINKLHEESKDPPTFRIEYVSVDKTTGERQPIGGAPSNPAQTAAIQKQVATARAQSTEGAGGEGI